MKKCNVNFVSQYAYIDNNNNYIHILDYIQNKNNYVHERICCKNNHELICVNGKKNKPHFRHKNTDDVGGCPMTEWHIEWQSNFPAIEVEFIKINECQIKTRRTDVLLNESSVIEFQHSFISKEEVDNRNHDYNLHNKHIIWVIDGNKNIIVNELKYCNRVYLEFTSELWKYESFDNCDYIYIDIQDKIYKIVPKLIKSNMIDVQQPLLKQKFIDSLLNKTNIFIETNPYQCRLFIKQQGAGNGKTYGIIKMLESEEFLHYKYFIYVSKQHSAVHVIYNEFKDQIQRGNLPYLQLEDEPKLANKKYIIKYRNLKTNILCQIIIGTIDSLMYAIGDKNHKELELFEGLVNSIIDNYIETITSCGTIKYGSLTPKLHKETLLIKDEEQDLTIPYAKAIIQIMRNRYIDVYIVGDKLQSISYETNAFTYLLENEFPYIEKIVYTFTNICHRFNHPKLVNFVNSMIPFQKYNLPEIQPYNKDEDKTNDSSIEPLVIFEGDNAIYANNKNENKLNTEIDIIMKYYEKEVNMYKRTPEDFLIVTPFTQSNPLVDALQLSINIFWKNIYDDDEFKRYAIFHKSEQGSSINLNESANSTRIVSIHSSKGDGRKVVFVIGLNEAGLNRFSGTSDSLIYDSLFHVAITRMKEKLYVRYINNSDNISHKLQKYLHDSGFEDSSIKPNIVIYDKINYSDIKTTLNTSRYFLLFEELIMSNINLQRLDENEDEKKIIDTSHHNIRYASIVINLYLDIIRNEKMSNVTDTKKQIMAILYDISKQGITETNNWKGYNNLLKENFIPILKISDKGREYKKYFDIIMQMSNAVLIKIKNIITSNGKNIDILCPIECIILYYMIQTSKNGIRTKFHISELYNIIDIYNKSFDKTISIKDHDKCLCKDCFDYDKSSTKQSINNTLESYIYTHFEKMNKISNNYEQFCLLYPSVNWLVDHTINFDGKTPEFKISKHFSLIGYDDNTAFVAYVKPQFNSLNYNITIMDAIFDTFIVKHVKKNETTENYRRFANKKVICVVFSTDLSEPYYIQWTDNDTTNNKDVIDENSDVILNNIKQSIISKYTIDCKMVYNFYKYWRKNCPEEISKPLDIINYIIQQFNIVKASNIHPIKGQTPNFITEFLNNIKFKLENVQDKKEQKILLKNYDNKEHFMEYIKQRIIDAIDRYFKKADSLDTDSLDTDSDTGFVSD
jgi:competence CoiA-like predicted nuclease